MTPGRTGVGGALLVTAVLAASWGTVAGLTVGAPAAWGVVTGAVLVAVVFSFGMVVTAAVAAMSPVLSLLVALLTYLVQLLLVVVALTAIERSGALGATLDRAWVGGTVIVGTLVWSAALVHAAVRTTAAQPPYHSQDSRRESSSAGDQPPEADGETAG